MSSAASLKLRDLIRAVRQCKTAADERALIQKESAVIRKAFNEGKASSRSKNVLKLLYIAMLGYPTEFGQMEVVKLLAEPDFSGKRIGYLTLQIILDENDEVLTLAENHMKHDLGGSHTIVQALALNTASNIAGEDMARDILDEVTKLVDSHNTYLRKKACLAAVRIVKKAPEHADVFLEAMSNVFQESNRTTRLTALALVNTCLRTEAGEAYVSRFRRLATEAVRVLKQLVLSSRITDQDVNGISDPFLQVKLLQFMRILGAGSAVTSEVLNDVLAQVITNTDSSRNVGCAVLYECVRTINSIESDDDLRTLGINTISRFLTSSRDNNLRFVALQLLNEFVGTDMATVQRHQATILDCLKDVDISIRRRALELTMALIDESNVRLFVPDLVTYLGFCAEEMREEVTRQLCSVIELKSPSSDWRLELSLRVLKLGKQFVPVSFATRLIGLISRESADLQKAAASLFWEEASYPFDAISQSRKALLLASVWCLGEYVDLVADSGKASVEAVAKCVAEITSNTNYTLIKQYGLTSLVKIASKYPVTKPVALPVFDSNSTSLDCELQQRACEYTTLLETFAEEAAASFARMPPIEPAEELEEVQPVQVVSVPAEEVPKPTTTFIDDLFGGVQAQPVAPVASTADVPSSSQGSPSSPIDSLFGPSPTTPTPTAAAAAPQPTAASPSPPAAAGVEVYRCADLVALVKASIEGTHIHTGVVLQSLAPTTLTDFSFQVAVPKVCTLDVAPLPSTELRAGETMTQKLAVDNANNTKNPRGLMLRIRLEYKKDNQQQDVTFQVSQTV